MVFSPSNSSTRTEHRVQPASQSEFNALAQLAAAGAINDGIRGVIRLLFLRVSGPFRDYLANAGGLGAVG